MKFPSVNAATDYCEMMGWGYDISYPNFKYHTPKNYAENFKYKGPAKPVVSYDWSFIFYFSDEIIPI